MGDVIEVNGPFERIPVCGCDSGKGDPPTKLQRLECKLRGGPCREVNRPEKFDKAEAKP